MLLSGLMWRSATLVFDEIFLSCGFHASKLLQTTQSVNVFTKIDNASKLLDGSYVKARIFGTVLKDVFCIPRKALLTDDKIFIVEGEKLKYVSPDIIYLDNELAYLRGLKVGALAVDEPMLSATEGMLVEIKE